MSTTTSTLQIHNENKTATLQTRVTAEERDQYGNLIMRLNDIGLDACVRYQKYEDGVKLAEIDVVKAVTGQNGNVAGPGQKSTTLITFQGALKLIMALPGINARDIRTKFADYLFSRFPELKDISMELVPKAFQPVQNAVLEEKDEHGNLIMRLNDIGLDAYVRYQRYEDGVRLAEIDVVKAVTAKSYNYSGEILRRLSNDVLFDIHANCLKAKFQGLGQKSTTLITFQGALKLIMALPGINAREIRTKFADVLQRYFAGDPSLVGELLENNMSTAPINKVAREDIETQQTSTESITMEQVMALIKESIEKTDKEAEKQAKARRRLELSDARIKRKHEIDLKDKELAIIRSETNKYIEKQAADKSELETKRKLYELEYEHAQKMARLSTPTVNVNVGTVNSTSTNNAPAVAPAEKVTVEQVTQQNRLLDGITDPRVRKNILSQVGSRLVRAPFNLKSEGKRDSIFYDDIQVNEFSAQYSDIIKNLVAKTAEEIILRTHNQNTMEKFFC